LNLRTFENYSISVVNTDLFVLKTKRQNANEFLLNYLLKSLCKMYENVALAKLEEYFVSID